MVHIFSDEWSAITLLTVLCQPALKDPVALKILDTL